MCDVHSRYSHAPDYIKAPIFILCHIFGADVVPLFWLHVILKYVEIFGPSSIGTFVSGRHNLHNLDTIHACISHHIGYALCVRVLSGAGIWRALIQFIVMYCYVVILKYMYAHIYAHINV